jgi:predicted O-methyltransferase YrrM
MIDNELEKYSEEHTSPETENLYKLNRETHIKVLMPRMLSGKIQGKFLTMLSELIRPKRILEIGTFTGYSALCLAKGMDDNGELITIDKNPELEFISKKYFGKSGLGEKIKLINGNALEIIPELEGNFDLVFIDADKANYLNYYKMLIDRVNSGGFIIADNVLWAGKVLHKDIPEKDIDTHGIIAFNDFVHEDVRVENLLLPLRDGLMILKKR